MDRPRDLVDEYVDAHRARAALRRRAPARRRACSSAAASPSLLPGPTLARLLDAIPRADGAEVTVECNPTPSTSTSCAPTLPRA
ncbi:MAG: hypothetical protein U0W40_13025 [Acidimicrobiia bacterium]